MSEMSVASINERAAEEYYRRGQEQEKEGNHEKAVEFYERALNENSDHEAACTKCPALFFTQVRQKTLTLRRHE